jgi:hypothetical protein
MNRKEKGETRPRQKLYPLKHPPSPPFYIFKTLQLII